MLEKYYQELLAQLRSSPLLRVGVWLIGIVLMLYAVLWLDDELTLKQLEWHREQTAVAELKSMQEQKHWAKTLEELESRNDELIANAWKAETTGLAKAVVGEFITRSTDNSHETISLRQTEFAEPQPVTDTFWEMRGRLSATLESQQVPWAWIATLEGQERAFILDSLEIRVGRRVGVSIDIEFRTLIQGLDTKSS